MADNKQYRIVQQPGFTDEQPFFLCYPDASGEYHDHYAGEVVSDIPHVSLKWLLADGLIEDASKPAKGAQKPAQDDFVTAGDAAVAAHEALDAAIAANIPEAAGGEQ